jgi:uncharacterized protein (DUF2147 family)
MKRLLMVAALASLMAGPAAADSFDVFGTYLLPKGDSHVKISDCGDGSPCGKVVWIRAEGLPSGKTPDTVTNEKGERIMGYPLLSGFDRKAKDWRGGKIHDPVESKT